MKKHSLFAAVAALGATAVTVGVATPVQAAGNGDVTVIGRVSQVPTALVRYADLDLGSQAGQVRLAGRIDLAARKLCGPMSAGDFNQVRAVGACRDFATASAEPQVKAAVARFQSGQQLALGDIEALTLSAG